MTTALYALGLQVYTEASITGVADGQITVTSACASPFNIGATCCGNNVNSGRIAVRHAAANL